MGLGKYVPMVLGKGCGTRGTVADACQHSHVPPVQFLFRRIVSLIHIQGTNIGRQETVVGFDSRVYQNRHHRTDSSPES
jgi:hypothetical protein